MNKRLVAFVFAATLVGGMAAARAQRCPAGQYLRAGKCKLCDAGKHCPAGTTYESMRGCKEGFYCPKGKKPVACPVGTSNPRPGAKAASACRDCAPGTFAASKGASACAACGRFDWSGPRATACAPIDCAKTPGYTGIAPACDCLDFYGPGPVREFGGGKPLGCAPLDCTSGPHEAGSVTGEPGKCVCAPGWAGRPVASRTSIVGGCTRVK